MRHTPAFFMLTAALLGGALLAALPAAGCGGKAVIDTGGSGGSTSTVVTTITTTITTTTGTTTTTADDCTPLEIAFDAAYAAAVACNPALSVMQCSGQMIIMDKCGCSVVANDTKPEENQQALDAYQAWEQAGCGPYDCGNCPPPPDWSWYCDPVSATCQPPNQ